MWFTANNGSIFTVLRSINTLCGQTLKQVLHMFTTILEGVKLRRCTLSFLHSCTWRQCYEGSRPLTTVTVTGEELDTVGVDQWGKSKYCHVVVILFPWFVFAILKPASPPWLVWLLSEGVWAGQLGEVSVSCSLASVGQWTVEWCLVCHPIGFASRHARRLQHRARWNRFPYRFAVKIAFRFLSSFDSCKIQQ